MARTAKPVGCSRCRPATGSASEERANVTGDGTRKVAALRLVAAPGLAVDPLFPQILADAAAPCRTRGACHRGGAGRDRRTGTVQRHRGGLGATTDSSRHILVNTTRSASHQ